MLRIEQEGTVPQQVAGATASFVFHFFWDSLVLLEIRGPSLSCCLSNIIVPEIMSAGDELESLARGRWVDGLLWMTHHLYGLISKFMSSQVCKLQAHLSIYLFDTSHLTDITKWMCAWDRTPDSLPPTFLLSCLIRKCAWDASISFPLIPATIISHLGYSNSLQIYKPYFFPKPYLCSMWWRR